MRHRSRNPYIVEREIRRKTLIYRIIFYTVVVITTIGYIIKAFEYKDFIEYIDKQYYNAIYNVSSLDSNDGEMSFHFIQLGNDKNGDCTYIKAGDIDIIIDAGSTKESCGVIKDYLMDYVSDGIIEYAIITHADSDHIAGFSQSDGLFSCFQFLNIIDFPLTNKESSTYFDYIKYRDKEVEEGANHYTALDCYLELNGGKRKYFFSDKMGFEVLYNYYYEEYTENENDYSVCVEFFHGDRKFLFTGDLEELGETKLCEINNLGEVALFKAGHHGSNTSSNELLLSKIKPKCCIVNCVCGGEYDFPSQEFLYRIAKYTDFVFATRLNDRLLNGDIVVTSNSDGLIFSFSNYLHPIKDCDWLIKNRVMPKEWEEVYFLKYLAYFL